MSRRMGSRLKAKLKKIVKAYAKRHEAGNTKAQRKARLLGFRPRM